MVVVDLCFKSPKSISEVRQGSSGKSQHRGQETAQFTEIALCTGALSCNGTGFDRKLQ